MTTFEFIKQQLEKSERKYGEAKKRLVGWEEGSNQKRLNELRILLAGRKYIEKEILEEGKEELKKEKDGLEEQISKRWKANSAVTAIERKMQYFADPAEWNSSLLKKIIEGSFLMIHGVRTSGKSSCIFRTIKQLNEKGYFCLYASFERLTYEIDNLKSVSFWKTFISQLLKTNRRTAGLSNSSQTWDEFLSLFEKWSELQQNQPIYSVVAIRTLSILYLNTIKALFEEFMSDRVIVIDPLVITDIYALTNRRAINKKLPPKDFNGRQCITYQHWQKFKLKTLLQEIRRYRTFYKMINKLKEPYSMKAVKFLRQYLLDVVEFTEVPD
ncbi:5039_t:CDS:2 [Funneliformis caledonium]|uniref:5039_t:CDS:1 n=1 Tax=Funneliformis caledonium TaxID=1117310 RepID=A0A9N9DLV9_9GLOM|nr:5039_t:CDS:2 [Funneliformis caledonium]